MGQTSIEWTAQRLPDGRIVAGYTTNAWSGCTKHILPSGKVDPECVPCYAEREEDARRGRSEWGKGKPRHPFKNWMQTMRQANRKAEAAGVYPFNFIESLSDWADQEVDEAWRDQLVDAAYAADHMTHLFLTKRAEEGAAYMMRRFPNGLPPHFWFGVSAGDKEGLRWRLEAAQAVKASVIFVSAEPLAEDISEALAVMLSRGLRLNWLLTGGPSGPFDDTTIGSKRVAGAWRSVAHSSWYERLMAIAAPYGVYRHFKQFGNFAPLTMSQAGVTPTRGVRVSVDGERELVKDGLVARDEWTATDSATWEFHGYLGGTNGKHAHGRTLRGRIYDEHPPVKVDR